MTDLFPTKIPAKTCPWLCHLLSFQSLGAPKESHQISGKSLAMREFSAETWQNYLSATQSQVFFLTRSHCGHAWGIIVPGVLPCFTVSGHYISQRDSLLGDKTWSCLGLLEFRCWINCVSSEWNGSIRSFVCLFACLFSPFSPRMISQIRAISMSLDHDKIHSWFKIRARD